MDTSPPLSVVDRFAQIIDDLCTVLIALLLPQCRFGMRFGGPSRRLVLRFCAELRGMSDMLRIVAAGIEAGRPVVSPSCGSDAALQGDAGLAPARLRHTERDASGRMARVVPCVLPRSESATPREVADWRLRDDSVGAGGVFSLGGTLKTLYVHFVSYS